MTKAKKTKESDKTVLVLRCCRADMTSQNGFTWPGVGEVAEAPDWKDDDACGHGLHAWLFGQGDHGCTDYWMEVGAKWLVIEVRESDVRMLGGKCKFPRGIVRFVGQKHEAAAHILAHEPQSANVSIIGLSVTVGDEQAAVVGALGTATAGDSGEIRVRWYDQKNNRYRTVIGYVGEDGIMPNVAYRLNDKNKLVPA